MAAPGRGEFASLIAEKLSALGAVHVAVSGGLARGEGADSVVSFVAAAADDVAFQDALLAWHPGGEQAFDQFRGEWDGAPFCVRVVLPERFGALSIWDTGSDAHIALLTKEAARMNLEIDESGIHHGGDLQDTPDEETAYRLLGLRVIPPAERRGTDEISRYKLT